MLPLPRESKLKPLNDTTKEQLPGFTHSPVDLSQLSLPKDQVFFVIGDLILDHAIFAVPKEVRELSNKMEQAYNVTHRQDTAGGAAAVARMLAVLNQGQTFYGVLSADRLGAVFAKF